MKILIITFCLIFSDALIAQQTLDTIYANDKKHVAMFFPKPIRQGITGSEHYVFTYNREKEQHFGLLQATPGTESNLLIITNDGKVYSYILKYADSISKLNYFIQQTESIGNEKPILKTPLVKTSNTNLTETKNSYYMKFCSHLMQAKHKRIAVKRKEGIALKLLSTTHHKEEVYLVIEIKNNSGIDFEIDYLNVYRTNGNKKRKASYQKLSIEILDKYKLTEVVLEGKSIRFVYVLPKFVLVDNEKLEIELQELKGSRSLALKTKL
ncbi:DUF4138 domain-containing protein [Flavisericum labens]|uniref:DUF4138 domain-containing protein n=1 Tax=Flavisericum labens TaxID=3377112 RepID=UPI00387AA398